MSEQAAIFESETVTETESAPATVYVVVSRYDGDPHPHCEGVYERESDAKEMMRNCRDTFSEPKRAVAWELEEMQVSSANATGADDLE